MTTQKPSKSNDNADTHWRIRELAVSARTSVSGLLREARISPATVHQWKTGECKPRPSTIQRLNEAAARLREPSATDQASQGLREAMNRTSAVARAAINGRKP